MFLLQLCPALWYESHMELNFEAGINAATEGRSLKEIALAMGCSYAHMCRAREHNALFAQSLDRARELGWFLQADRLRTLVDDNPTVDVHRLRLQADNIKWLLARIMPQVFGDRLEIKHELVRVDQALSDARARVIPAVDIPPELLE